MTSIGLGALWLADARRELCDALYIACPRADVTRRVDFSKWKTLVEQANVIEVAWNITRDDEWPGKRNRATCSPENSRHFSSAIVEDRVVETRSSDKSIHFVDVLIQ